NWHPFIPPNEGPFGAYGWSGVFRGAAVVFFAYIGFDAVSTSAQEARNPQRDMPFGLLGSLALCTILYVVVCTVMVGLVPYKQMLNEPAPMVVAIAAGFTGIATLGSLVSIGTLLAFIIVSIGIIFLRRTRPELERPFKVPFVPFLPASAAIVSLILMASLPWTTWERLIIWMVIGI